VRKSTTSFNQDAHIDRIHNENNDADDGDNSDGNDDDDDNGGNNYAFTQRNDTDTSFPCSLFTCKEQYTHCTRDEDHGCRAGGPGMWAISKDYTRRIHQIHLEMPSSNEDNISITFESTTLGSSDDGYRGFEISNHPYTQLLIYEHMVGKNQETYSWHVRDYIQNHSNYMSWYQYCINLDVGHTTYEPPRTSFWY